MSDLKVGRHDPVLLREAIEALSVRPDGIYVDCTFGRGGHARSILGRLGPTGMLYALDRDPEAVHSAGLLLGEDSRFRIERGSFGALAKFCASWGIAGQVDGLLLDIGVSSPQLDDPARGFSFMEDGPLDMRMDPDDGPSAAEWLRQADEREIAQVLWRYGEERYARRIARAIVATRSESPLETTGDLASLVNGAVPYRERSKHPATRTFQALRILINRELDALKAGLEQSLDVLRSGGRLVVICFHSLEDRLVKRFIRANARVPQAPRRLPVNASGVRPKLRAVGKLVRPSEVECHANPRARSALMRVAEVLA